VLTPAREPRSCTTVQVVPLLDDKAVLATVVAKLLNPLLLPPEHFEASCLHALKHLGDSCLDAHPASLMRGVVLQQLQAVMAILVG